MDRPDAEDEAGEKDLLVEQLRKRVQQLLTELEQLRRGGWRVGILRSLDCLKLVSPNTVSMHLETSTVH